MGLLSDIQPTCEFTFQHSWLSELRGARVVALQGSNLIQETERSRRRGRGARAAWREVLNRHQRHLHIPFSKQRNIPQLSFLSLHRPIKPVLTSAQTSDQSAEGCAAHAFPGTVIYVCMSNMSSGTYWRVLFKLDVGCTCPRPSVASSTSREAFTRRGMASLTVSNPGRWVSD